MSTAQKDKDTKKAANDIRIGMNSRPRNVIKYTISIVEEQKLREVKFSAVGGSIGTLLDVVEVIKVLKPGLHQQNRITSVAYQTVDSNKTLLNQRLYPKLEVTLSLDEPKNKNEGYQGVLEEEKENKFPRLWMTERLKEKKIEVEEEEEEVDLEVEEEEEDLEVEVEEEEEELDSEEEEEEIDQEEEEEMDQEEEHQLEEEEIILGELEETEEEESKYLLYIIL